MWYNARLLVDHPEDPPRVFEWVKPQQGLGLLVCLLCSVCSQDKTRDGNSPMFVCKSDKVAEVAPNQDSTMRENYERLR